MFSTVEQNSGYVVFTSEHASSVVFQPLEYKLKRIRSYVICNMLNHYYLGVHFVDRSFSSDENSKEFRKFLHFSFVS